MIFYYYYSLIVCFVILELDVDHSLQGYDNNTYLKVIISDITSEIDLMIWSVHGKAVKVLTIPDGRVKLS